MGVLSVFLFGRNQADIKKNTYVWNMLAGISSALESVVFSLIVTRVTGLSDAGMITLGFAVGNLLATVGKYGVRTFQVTDVNRNYSFSAYYYARLITIVLMIVSGCGYILYCYHNKGYTVYKTIVVLLICAKFVVETFEDVIAGECQKNGRLDVASRVFILRSASFIILFTASLIITKQVITSLLIALGGIALIEVLSLRTVISRMEFHFHFPGWDQIKEIIVKCTPLFLSTFAFFYVTNAPKYAIDTVMSDEVQACYGFIAFPVFAIELLNNFIYQPVLVSLAENWAKGELSAFKKRIHFQILIVTGMTCAALVVAWFMGIPVLSAVFATDLTGYKTEMMILLFTGGLLALIGYFSTILITMRQSTILLIGYLTDLVLSVLLYTPVIRAYGIRGGVLLYSGLCAAFAIYSYVFIRIRMKQARR